MFRSSDRFRRKSKFTIWTFLSSKMLFLSKKNTVQRFGAVRFGSPYRNNKIHFLLHVHMYVILNIKPCNLWLRSYIKGILSRYTKIFTNSKRQRLQNSIINFIIENLMIHFTLIDNKFPISVYIQTKRSSHIIYQIAHNFL